MNDDRKDKMIDGLAKTLAHMSSDSYERSSKYAVLICFAMKYVLAATIYIAARNFVGQMFGELWIALVLAYALYGHELYISLKIKEELIKSFLKKQQRDEKEDDEEDEEDTLNIEKLKEKED